jgi:DHA1 family multidrug resistance protein-like MFS transporter
LLVLQALIGVALGGIIPAISALLAHLTQTGEEGAVYGLDNSITAGSRALAPLLGAAVAATFSLRAVFSFTGVLFAFTALMGLFLLPSGKTAEDNVR